ncbi:conserved protein of unknown function [Rhodovastum atsumiense]|uniref:Uncharacterized protein n=1 Tax=Rhodovastum atsumiense TaxID=504468 RepID=A0A5M6IY18_9PROT|nr:hypothetical protein [Rhodovastum atsumiense]KAA5612717.1 hypothetical protein F1189_08245 [Rhodovastum atsumiense]CAH2602729.1 conserved protein of unknown function [Rhodovastum atsumiense]
MTQSPAGTDNRLQVLSLPELQRALCLAEEDPALQALLAQPARLLEHLMEAGRLDDALRFLAHALPGREAMWWGCMCATATLPAPDLPAERATLAAVEAWVRQPADERRRHAIIAAARNCTGLPAGWLGLAISWNHALGGMAGFGPGVEGAVFQALDRAGEGVPDADAARRRESVARRFIASGLAIAHGEAGRIAQIPPGPHAAEAGS